MLEEWKTRRKEKRLGPCPSPLASPVMCQVAEMLAEAERKRDEEDLANAVTGGLEKEQ